jgi:hypothetical protein
MMFPWGSVIGAAGGIASSLFGSSSQKKANKQALQLAREQLAYQKELAHNQVQWRVEDTKKAGLHPLAALGVSPMSYSPVSSSAVGADYSGVGQSLQQMGQDIDRARMAGLDREERKKALALQDTQTALALKNQELNNQILEQELISRRVKLFQQLTPGMASLYGLDRRKYAIPGQDDAVMPRAEGTVATGEPRYQFMQTPNGSYSLEPGNDWAQAYEDKLLVEWLPIFQTAIRDFTARAKGEEIDGMRYDADRGGWVPSHIKVKDPWYKRFRDWLRSPAPDLRDIWTRGATRAYRY